MAEAHRCHHAVRRGPGRQPRQFYRDVFGLPIHFENDDSAVFKFGETVINLLRVTNADELISPAVVAPPDAGSRMVFTIGVDDVDAMSRCSRRAAWSCSTGRWIGPGGSEPRASSTRPATSGRSPRRASPSEWDEAI